MGAVPVWLVDGEKDGEVIFLGVFTGERKAVMAVAAAEREGFGEIMVSPYPANARLWTDEGAKALRGLEAQIEAERLADPFVDDGRAGDQIQERKEWDRVDAEAIEKANALPAPKSRRVRR